VADFNDLIKDAAGIVTNPVGSAISGAVNFLSGLFTNEDKSDAGFKSFLNSGGSQGVVPPPRDEIIYWGQQAGWAKDNLDAIYNTYQQSNGTFKKGDWNGVVISTWPITVRLFKGSGESFILSTQDFFAPDIGSKTPNNTTVMAAGNNVAAPMPGKTSQPLTNNIAQTADQILGNESFGATGIDYAKMAADITKQILGQQSAGNNSSQGTSLARPGTSMNTWLILGAIGVGIYFLTSKKRS